MNAKIAALVAKHLGSSARLPMKVKPTHTSKPSRPVRAETKTRATQTLPDKTPKTDSALHKFPLDLDVLNDAIAAVVHCMSHDTTRKALNLISIEPGKSSLHATATNGVSLSHVELACHQPTRQTLVIPSQLLDNISRLRSPGYVKIFKMEDSGYRGEGQALDFTIAGANGSVHVTDESTTTFPPWHHVVPAREDQPTTVSVSAKNLAEAIRKIPKSSDLHTMVVCAFTQDAVLISDAGKDQNGEGIPGSNIVANLPYSGVLPFQPRRSSTETTFVMTSAYDKSLLLRSLKSMGYNEITLRFSNSFEPVRIELPGDPESRFDIVMPMRLNR